MKKLIIFPLWKTENIEIFLEKMEQNGYRLENVKYSYWFCFKKSIPKKMSYFLSYKSFRGQSMAFCDYAMLTNHHANEIDSKMCSFTVYRTKDNKEDLTLLYEGRLDYIKRKLLENALTSLFCLVLFSCFACAAVMNSSVSPDYWVIMIPIGVSICFTVYYGYGYFKQKNKCKKYEKNMNTEDGSAS